MSLSQPRWLAAIGGALLAHVILIASAIAWVAVYSYLIAPGLEVSAYHAHARVSAPWVSLLVGIPVLFLLCLRIGRLAPLQARATTLALLAIYLCTDMFMLLATTPVELVPWGLVLANYGAKFAAGWLGGESAHGLRRDSLHEGSMGAGTIGTRR